MALKRMKELRQAKKITQQDLAIEFKTAQTTISKWEKGERTPDPETLIALAKFFDVSVDYLLGLEPKERSAFNLQRFGAPQNRISYLASKVIAMSNEEQKEKTCSIIEQVLRLSDEQRDKLFELLKVM